jgi:hypothetical protein
MRKVFCRTAVVAAVAVLAQGCVKDLSPVRVRAKSGVSASTLGTGGGARKDRNAFTFGAFLNRKVASWISFQPEFLYTTKGQSGKRYSYDIIQGWYESGAFDYRLAYLEVPLLFRFTSTFAALLPEGTKAPHVYVMLGPYYGFLLDAQVFDVGASGSYTSSDMPRRVDGGVAVVVGVEHDWPAGHFEWDILRLHIGTTTIFEPFDNTLQNFTISTMMGFWF